MKMNCKSSQIELKILLTRVLETRQLNMGSWHYIASGKE